MADREALHELHARLADRLQAARDQQQQVASWLAVECRGHGLLFPLQQAGEIFPLTPLLPVPHARLWFVGVANLRGGLYGVVDLAAFLGLGRTETAREGTRDPARLVALGGASGLNCALLVERLAGLRNESQLKREMLPAEEVPGPVLPAFAGARYRDADGRAWQEILLSALADDPQFLAIAGH